MDKLHLILAIVFSVALWFTAGVLVGYRTVTINYRVQQLENLHGK